MLPKKTWDLMGRQKLQWSLIHLRMDNQHKILCMGRLHGIVVVIEGVCVIVDFEAIETLDDNNPYLALLGLDWDFDNLVIINLKKRQMVLKKDNLRVIVPLYPSKRVCYIGIFRNEYCDADVNNIYQMKTKDEHWINPTLEGKLSWEQDSSCTSDFEE